MEELKRLQEQAARMEAIAWLSNLFTALFTGATAVLNGIFALFSGCIGFAMLLLASAPLLFFCLLFFVIAAAMH